VLTVNHRHLGERRFADYPLFVAIDVQNRLRRMRLALLGTVALGVVLTGALLLTLR
jgi:hypothetical protein